MATLITIHLLRNEGNLYKMKKFILIYVISIVSIATCIVLYQILVPEELDPNERLNQLLKGRNC